MSVNKNESIKDENDAIRADIENRVKEVVAEQLGKKASEISGESSFVNDLGADSLGVVELIMALEDEFALIIADDDAVKLVNINEVVTYIIKHQK
jgi:acyl carrier protein